MQPHICGVWGANVVGMTDVPTIALNSGTSIPQLGLGVWQTPNDDAERLVRFAIDEAGYRHIDTAKIYGNEEGVGRGIATSGVPREEIFLTTKLWNADHGRDRALAAFDESLQRLGTDYVDLYLIHWPLGDDAEFLATWHALEQLHSEGRARAIGLSNATIRHLDLVLAEHSVAPAIDQVELHPHFQQLPLRQHALEHGIAVESWSPLGGTGNSGWGKNSRPNTVLANETIADIAAEHSVSPAQVVIRWHLQNGLVVIPKSTHEQRIAQNIDVFGFELTEHDLQRIAALNTGERVGADPDTVR